MGPSERKRLQSPLAQTKPRFHIHSFSSSEPTFFFIIPTTLVEASQNIYGETDIEIRKDNCLKCIFIGAVISYIDRQNIFRVAQTKRFKQEFNSFSLVPVNHWTNF
jgi:hypothetical protein